MAILPKAVYRFYAIPIKISMTVFTELEQMNNPKIYMDSQKTLSSQTIFRKKNKAGSITRPDFWLYYKATVIKTVW